MSGPHVLTLAEVEAAAEEYGANCGPAALAAVLGLSLAEIRPHLGDFEAKGYMNPAMMLAALRSLGVKWRAWPSELFVPVAWPLPGLCRVQWDGPWMAPAVPAAARYKHTHWVGARIKEVAFGGTTASWIEIFDVNAIALASHGWISVELWRDRLVPLILKECQPKASGAWHLTHRLQVVSGPADGLAEEVPE